MLVHFAAGVHPFPRPWWNVDYAGGDQFADLLDPLPRNLTGIDWAYVGHFLEHLTPAEGVEFLGRVRERMSPGGRVVVIGPDVDKGQEWYEHGRIGEALRARIGAWNVPAGRPGRDRGDCHLWGCTGTAVVDQLTEAGWGEPAEFPIGELPARFPEVPIIDLSGWQFAATATATPAPQRAGRYTRAGSTARC